MTVGDEVISMTSNTDITCYRLCATFCDSNETLPAHIAGDLYNLYLIFYTLGETL